MVSAKFELNSFSKNKTIKVEEDNYKGLKKKGSDEELFLGALQQYGGTVFVSSGSMMLTDVARYNLV